MVTLSHRSRLGIVLLVVLVRAFAFAQGEPTQASPPPAQPPDRAIISFLVPIDSNSVNLLLAIVNNQVRAGFKKITIVISSPGGDTASAFAAYNVLKSIPAEITTFNAGSIDSAAMLIYLSGKYRYSFGDPARFLIHGNSMTLGTNVPMDYAFLNAQLQQMKSLNQMVAQVIANNSNKKNGEIETLMQGQVILSPEEAKLWGLVQEIRPTFMEPGA